MANATRKGHMGAGTVVGHTHVGTTDPTILDEDDLADTLKDHRGSGDEGDERVRNQRTVLPGSREERNQAEAVEADLAAVPEPRDE